MSRYSRIISTLSCVVLIGQVMGCATFHLAFDKKMPKATPVNPAVEILCLWQPGEGVDPDGYPCKGFQGQIVFLNRASAAVQIEGEVRIYLFDDQGTPEEQSKPLRSFNFDNGSWAIHLADSSLGPSYSVFVPYVRRGTTDAACSLRVRLKPKQGPVVFSDFSNLPLNGGKKALRGDDAQPITKNESDKLAAEAMAGALRRTTTITAGSDQKLQEVAPESKKDATASPIQLASHEVLVPTEKETADAERIRRLEAMVQQLMEQKAGAAATPTPTASAGSPPAELDDGPTDPSQQLKPSRRIKVRRNDDDEPRPTAIRRRAHPLDDNEPSMSDHANERELAPKTAAMDPVDFATELTAEQRYTYQDQRYRRSPR